MSDPYSPPQADLIDQQTASNVKQRHGCLWTYLIISLIVNSLVGLMYTVGYNVVLESQPNMEFWMLIAYVALVVLNIVCLIALFRWRKWGFYGFFISAIFSTILNIILELPIGSIIGGVAGIGVLFLALKVGAEKQGWNQLE